jgi:hypothetical protein
MAESLTHVLPFLWKKVKYKNGRRRKTRCSRSPTWFIFCICLLSVGLYFLPSAEKTF